MFAQNKNTACRRLGVRFGVAPCTWAVLIVATILALAWSDTGVGQVSGQISPLVPGRSPTSPLNPSKPKTYQEVLTFGLQAKLPSEVAFVDSVVKAVETGQLPAVLVDQTYFWARTRSGSSFYGSADAADHLLHPGARGPAEPVASKRRA